jgi:hypothetical protein
MKFWVAQYVLANHGPQIRAFVDCVEGFKFAIVIFIVVLPEWYDISLHLFLFFCEPPNYVSMFNRGHGEVEYIDVIMVQYINTIF